jgi:2-phosphosulfolactate phosphatase
MEIHADGLMIRSISVALIPQTLPDGLDLRQACSIVIDVLRATSVMTTAGNAGARKIFTCQATEQAHEMAGRVHGDPLLCGERHCKPIEGFHLGNSPAEYTHDVVAGKEMILTTTNGTRAIDAVLSSRRLLAGSFLNLNATVDAIADERQLQIVCAGTNGEISYEDVLLAGAIVDRLKPSERSIQIDDSARIARSAWRQVLATESPLEESLRQSLGGRNLIAVGFEADVDRCAKTNTIDGVVERVDGERAVFEFRSAP